jgi:hypothetical protein
MDVLHDPERATVQVNVTPAQGEVEASPLRISAPSTNSDRPVPQISAALVGTPDPG